MKTKYPNIWEACFLITLDNGGLHRGRSESQIEQEFDGFLLGVEEHEIWDLQKIDNWISTLSRKSHVEIESQLETLCCGEETEMEELYKEGPQGAYALLNAWFDGPC